MTHINITHVQLKIIRMHILILYIVQLYIIYLNWINVFQKVFIYITLLFWEKNAILSFNYL